MKATLLVLACMIAVISAQNLRFVNNVEGTTLTIYSNKIDPQISVAYQASSAWYPIADGTISITH